MSILGRTALLFLTAVLFGWTASAAPESQLKNLKVSLKTDLSSPQRLGTSIRLTAVGSDHKAGTLAYQFSVGPAGGPLQIVQDFSTLQGFSWTPAVQEGTYQLQVVVENETTLQTAQAAETYVIIPVATTTSVVSKTGHPLVALFSAPPCPVGSTIRVEFQKPAGTPSFTNVQNCAAGLSVNWYVAGMRASTTYQMRYQLTTGSSITYGPLLSFTTGPLPKAFPSSQVLIPPGSSTDPAGVVLWSYLPGGKATVYTTALDLEGNVIWYYPAPGLYLTRPVAGGTMLFLGADLGSLSGISADQIAREVDLAGNTLRSTNAGRLSQEIQALGNNPLGCVHHESVRLPNGNTALFGTVERIFTNGVQGSSTKNPVDVLGDYVVVLDQNFQVIWAWNAFDPGHFDVNRPAVLGETCANGTPGCPHLFLSNTANDWLHTNSIYYVPQDGSLIVSSRHQYWVVKIDYGNGLGTGNILWRLGAHGDFSILSSDPYPWFSHQHDVEYEQGGTQFLSVFDNGNTRVAVNPGKDENSRGQLLNIDEANKTVTLQINADLGGYSYAYGSARALSNGDYNFQSGALILAGSPHSQTVEYNVATNAFDYEVQVATAGYRSFRMVDLYTPPN